MAARSMADLGFVTSGMLLIAGRRSGVHVLRVSVCGLIALSLFGMVKSMVEIPQIRQQWSTPAAAASQAIIYLNDYWLPLLLLALTLLPLVPPAKSRGERRAEAGIQP
jgi:hypothetical protein